MLFRVADTDKLPKNETQSSPMYTARFVAVDGGGAETEIMAWDFNVVVAPDFNLKTLPTRTAPIAGIGYADPNEADQLYVVDKAYKIAPLQLSPNTTVSSGSTDNITFTLSTTAPDTWFVQAATGVIFGEFSAVGNYSFSVLAVDAGGKTAEVESLNFTVVNPPVFKVTVLSTRTEIADDFINPATTSGFVVGETYKIAPLKLDLSPFQTTPTAGDIANITYSLRNAPKTFFIQPESGVVFGTFSASGEYDFELLAVDAAGQTALLEILTFQVYFEDTADASNGPNNRDCGPGVAVDSVKFDRSFTCNCSATKFVGDNCDVEVAASSTADTDTTTTTIVGVVLGIVVLALFLIAAGLRYRTYKASMKAFDFEAELERMRAEGDLLGGTGGIPREIKRSHVTMTDEIGAGAFGEVWKGILDESAAGGVPGYAVAIKTSKDSYGEGADELLREATVMAQVTNHVNLVSLIGAVTSGTPLLLLLSLCDRGSLLSVLKSLQTAIRPVGDNDRLRYAIEIARGMAHLVAHRFVHRDLAARNVLLDGQDICKIADFGLSRATKVSSGGASDELDGEDADGAHAEYYRSQSGTFPVRWTSPEAMQALKFTTASDIWSYGITLVEIYTEGDRPYGNMDNTAVINAV